MKERILSTEHGQFLMRNWDGENGSGIQPLGDKVLILVDPAMDVTRGGIIITDQNAETQTMSSTTGLVVALGDQAFLYDAERVVGWTGLRPEPGRRVFFQKYAGQIYTGTDGKLYRLLQDRSIGGVEQLAAEAA